MLYMRCKHGVSQYIMYTRGTEILIFWPIENLGK